MTKQTISRSPEPEPEPEQELVVVPHPSEEIHEAPTAELTAPQPQGPPGLTREQVDLIKRTVARGATDDELRLFLYAAQRMGLDPLAGQIHAVKRWNSRERRETLSLQVGIDGYRLSAERTGRYAPGPEPSYHEIGDQLVSATAYVKKLVAGVWHNVAATAFYAEYVQRGRDGKPTALWERMPRLMLAKCAEALALRRAFPAELSGVYTWDEMAQAESGARLEAPLDYEGPPHDDERPPSETPSCAHCGSVNVEPDGANYYRCLDCNKGTPRNSKGRR